MTTVSSCRIMLAVMYGMIPSANTDSWSRAPPENRFSSVYTPLELESPCRSTVHCYTLAKETPGLGSVAPSR